MTKVSVFPAAASLQTGSSTGFSRRPLDAIYNHSIKKLPITAGKLGKLDPHSTGRNRVIRPMHIYPDYFGINRKTTI